MQGTIAGNFINDSRASVEYQFKHARKKEKIV